MGDVADAGAASVGTTITLPAIIATATATTSITSYSGGTPDDSHNHASDDDAGDSDSIVITVAKANTTHARHARLKLEDPDEDSSDVVMVNAVEPVDPKLLKEKQEKEANATRRLTQLRTSALHVSTDFSVQVNTSGIFDKLPDELVIKILTLTNLRTIGKISQTCSRMYALAWDPGLWNFIAKKRNWSEKQTKAFYISEFKKAKQRKEDAKRAKIQAEIRRKAEAKKRRAKNYVIAASSRLWEWLYICIGLYFLITLVLKLESVIDWPWIAIAGPVLACFVHIYFFISLYIGMKVKYEIPDIEPSEGDCYTPIFNSLWFQGVENDDCGQRCSCFSPIFVTLPFQIMLFIWLVGGEDDLFPRWILPIPLHLLSAYLMVLPGCAGVHCGKRSWKQLVWQQLTVGAILLSIFLCLLSIKLADPGGPIAWIGVLSPMITLQLWLVACPLLICTGQICCINMHGDDSLLFGGWIVGAICVGTLVLAFEFMLAMTLDGTRDYQWSIIMVPWYIIAVALVIGAIFTNLVLFFDD
ncbi:hypothetical protein Pelo_16574 [Pelomyxa schiedti]|nr:hypothetical protein Pelo_16574 [Pelomyxa schiedti]